MAANHNQRGDTEMSAHYPSRGKLALLGFGLVVVSSAGCSALTSASSIVTKLNIGMNGMPTIPDGATGNNDPVYQQYSLETVTLTKADGTAVVAYSGEAKDLRIINRPQIITTYDMSNDVGSTINSIAVTFSSTVIGAGRYRSDLAIALENPTLTYSVPFTVTKAQDRRLDIYVNWQNTMTESDSDKSDSLQAPGFELKLTPN